MTWCGSTSLPLSFKNFLICAGRVDPHGIRQAHQPDRSFSRGQRIQRFALFAHLAWCGSTSLPLAAIKTSSSALAGSIPTEFGKLINMKQLRLGSDQLSGTPPFAHIAWCGSKSLPLALKASSCALAGSIPTEFGKLINMISLRLEDNKLSGTPSLPILPGLVVRVYHCFKNVLICGGRVDPHGIRRAHQPD